MDWQTITIMALGCIIACTIAYYFGYRRGANATLDFMRFISNGIEPCDEEMDDAE